MKDYFFDFLEAKAFLLQILSLKKQLKRLKDECYVSSI